MSSAPGGESLKAALDTNVYVAAFNAPKGRNARLWDAALAGRFRIVVSPAIIREMANVLRDKFGWQDERARRMLGPEIVPEVAGVSPGYSELLAVFGHTTPCSCLVTGASPLFTNFCTRWPR
jgi:hypothetical protein